MHPVRRPTEPGKTYCQVLGPIPCLRWDLCDQAYGLSILVREENGSQFGIFICRGSYTQRGSHRALSEKSMMDRMEGKARSPRKHRVGESLRKVKAARTGARSGVSRVGKARGAAGVLPTPATHTLPPGMDARP